MFAFNANGQNFTRTTAQEAFGWAILNNLCETSIAYMHAYGPYLKAHCLFIYAKGWNKIVYISIPLCYILHFVAVSFPVFLVDITKKILHLTDNAILFKRITLMHFLKCVSLYLVVIFYFHFLSL